MPLHMAFFGLNKADKIRANDYTKQVIKGGNHAQFGNYGLQKGDGQATISRKAQQQATAQAVRQYLLAHDK